MRYFFVVNPTAGRGRANAVWDRLLHRLKKDRLDFGYALTSAPEEATHMTQDVVRAGYDAVVGVGGDGTLHEVAAGLPKGGALGVIPAGTGNDFARTLRLPKDPERSLDMLLRARPTQVDRCRVNGRSFLNVAGIGFDAMVAKAVQERSTGGSGTFPYLASVFRLLATYKNTPVTVDVDGQRIETTTLLIAVGNGAYIGGGMRICPHAKLNDGLFDVCIAGDFGKVEALFNLPRLFRGSHTDHPKVQYLQAQHVRVEAANLPCQADGELIGNTPIEFEMESEKMTLLAPS